MNTRYCSNCGNKHVYTLEKPRFCTKCGKDMDAAFATVTPKPAAPIAAPQSPVYASRQPIRAQRRFVNARGQDMSHLYASQERAEALPQEAYDDGDYVDPYQKDEIRQQLEASISAEDFGISADADASDKTVRLGDVLGPILAQQQAQGGKKRRSRKS